MGGDVKLKVTGKVALHGVGPAPAGQTFALPKFPGAKFALTFCAWLMVTTHVGTVPALAHAPPPQPTNVDPEAAPAVSVTWAPLA
jgi:hypothetical protein